jgi:hypothetical protein
MTVEAGNQQLTDLATQRAGRHPEDSISAMQCFTTWMPRTVVPIVLVLVAAVAAVVRARRAST